AVEGGQGRIQAPRRAAVGVALEPESSRWRLQGALRLSVGRTCTPAPACNPRGCAYRLRDITDWRALQGVAPVYASSADFCIRIVGQCLIDPFEQVAHLLAGGAAGLHVRAFLVVQQVVGDV